MLTDPLDLRLADNWSTKKDARAVTGMYAYYLEIYRVEGHTYSNVENEEILRLGMNFPLQPWVRFTPIKSYRITGYFSAPRAT
jgi:hypothetical protein